MRSSSSVPQKVIEYVSKKETVSIEDIVKDLGVSWITAKNYLSRLARIEIVKRVGRGVYQRRKRSTAIVKPTPELIRLGQELRERFPMADFVVWSLNMLADYAHYAVGRDLVFVETSKMLSASIRDALVEKGYRAVLRPYKRDFQEYAYYPEQPIFILERKELYGLVWFEDNLIPTPERIWLDLYFFTTRMGLSFDLFELGLIFANMVERDGINFDRLLRYAGRRGLFREMIIFLYSLKREGTRIGSRIPEDVLWIRRERETLQNILTMVKGADRE